MNEDERARTIEFLQLELFCLKRQLERQAEQLELAFKHKLELVRQTGTKVCRKCSEERSVKLFYRDDRYKDGSYPYCRICKSEMSRARKNAA